MTLNKTLTSTYQVVAQADKYFMYDKYNDEYCTFKVYAKQSGTTVYFKATYQSTSSKFADDSVQISLYFNDSTTAVYTYTNSGTHTWYTTETEFIPETSVTASYSTKYNIKLSIEKANHNYDLKGDIEDTITTYAGSSTISEKINPGNSKIRLKYVNSSGTTTYEPSSGYSTSQISVTAKTKSSVTLYAEANYGYELSSRWTWQTDTSGNHYTTWTTGASNEEWTVPTTEKAKAQLTLTGASNCSVSAYNNTTGKTVISSTTGSGNANIVIGDSITLYTSTTKGYTFGGWSDGTTTATSRSFTMSSSTTSYSVNTPEHIQYEIDVASGGDGIAGVSTSKSKAYYGDSVTLTASVVDGFDFNYWEDSNKNKYYDNPQGINVSGDNTYTAYAKESTVKFEGKGLRVESYDTLKVKGDSKLIYIEATITGVNMGISSVKCYYENSEGEEVYLTITQTGTTYVVKDTLAKDSNRNYIFVITDSAGGVTYKSVYVSSSILSLSIAQTKTSAMLGFGTYADYDTENSITTATDMVIQVSSSNTTATQNSVTKKLFDLLICPFPVGSVYLSYGGSDPNDIWEGTSWTQLYGGQYIKASSSKGDEGGSTGGDSSSASINNGLSASSSISGFPTSTGSTTLSTDQIPSHTHSLGMHKSSVETTTTLGLTEKESWCANKVVVASDSSPTSTGTNTTSNLGHTHTISWGTNAKVTTSLSGSITASVTSAPAYIEVGFWKRTK